MKPEESGSTLRTAIQPPHLDIRRRSPSQDESAPIIGLSHRADSGGAVSAQETTSRAPAGSIESIDSHTLQIPAHRASLFHPFFNFISTLNQHTPSPLLLCLLRSSLPFVRWRRRPIHPAAGRIAPDQTRPGNAPLMPSGEPHNRLLTSRDGAARKRLTEIALASDLVCFPGMAKLRYHNCLYRFCMTITHGQCRAEYTSSLSAPGAQIVFFPVSLYRFLRPHCSLHPFASRRFRIFGQT